MFSNHSEIVAVNIMNWILLTAPGVSWQAALKMTGVTLDLLIYIDQHLFIEASIPGGVAFISHRHGQGNLPDLPNYDSNKPKQHMVYWD